MYNNVLLICLIILWTKISPTSSLVRLLIGLPSSTLNNYRHCFSLLMIRWLGVRLEIIANLIILSTAITSVFVRDHLSAGTVGLMMTYALQITNSLNLLVRTSSEIETNIVSVERINEYAELHPEAPWRVPMEKSSSDWPKNGTIQYVDCSRCLFRILRFIFSRIKELSTRYRENLQLVLKDVTLTVEHGEKVR